MAGSRARSYGDYGVFAWLRLGVWLVIVPADDRRLYLLGAAGLWALSVASNGLLEWHHDWTVRGVQMGVAAVTSTLFFRVSRRVFLRTLAQPLPRRGFGGWLVTLPGWLMVLVWLVVMLVPTEAFLFVGLAPWHDAGAGAAGLAMGACIAFTYWGVSAAWLVLRRRAEVVT